jgi:hypothetical protein
MALSRVARFLCRSENCAILWVPAIEPGFQSLSVRLPPLKQYAESELSDSVHAAKAIMLMVVGMLDSDVPVMVNLEKESPRLRLHDSKAE